MYANSVDSLLFPGASFDFQKRPNWIRLRTREECIWCLEAHCVRCVCSEVLCLCSYADPSWTCCTIVPAFDSYVMGLLAVTPVVAVVELGKRLVWVGVCGNNRLAALLDFVFIGVCPSTTGDTYSMLAISSVLSRRRINQTHRWHPVRYI